ncbi:MAG: proline racemase [Acidimicrobiia bacterium]|nr:proline racemase [Acidimicrobiia bacterium]
MHTGGEPVRIIVGGYPELTAPTLLGKRREALEHHDHIRRLLMLEPRGHAAMYGAIPVIADNPEADFAVLFIHGEGYSTMCGHAVIALGRWAVDSGLVAAVEPETVLKIQVPCGLVEAKVEVSDGVSGAVSFVSVDAFAHGDGHQVDVPGLGTISVDIGYGGAFYAIVDDRQLGLTVGGSPIDDLVQMATRVTAAASASVGLRHPTEPDLEFLYGTIVTDGRDGSAEPSQNVCVFADRQVDRSPTGSGVTARMAVQHARGELDRGDARRFSSLTDAVFGATVVSASSRDGLDSVRVQVSGEAFYTGRATFHKEDADPVEGFLLD